MEEGESDFEIFSAFTIDANKFVLDRWFQRLFCPSLFFLADKKDRRFTTHNAECTQRLCRVLGIIIIISFNWMAILPLMRGVPRVETYRLIIWSVGNEYEALKKKGGLGRFCLRMSR